MSRITAIVWARHLWCGQELLEAANVYNDRFRHVVFLSYIRVIVERAKLGRVKRGVCAYLK